MKQNIESELFELMFELSRSIKEKVAYGNDARDITLQQYMALEFIKRNTSIQMKEIAEHFSIEMPTATSLLNKLAGLSLVRRETDTKDRRVVNVRLSKKGELLLVSLRKEKEKKVKKMVSYLTDQQKNNLRDILETLLSKENKYEK